MIGEVDDLALSGGEKASYLATITQELRGEYELALLLDRDPNKALAASDGTSPQPNPLFSGVPPNFYLFVSITPGAKDPSQCYATTSTGLALHLAVVSVGETLRIRIEERDTYGNLRDTITFDEFAGAPAYFDIRLYHSDPAYADREYTVNYPDQGLTPPPANADQTAVANFYFLLPGDAYHDIRVLAGGNGTSGSFNPYVAGDWFIEITDAGQPIKGSPLRLTFRPGPFSIDNTVVYGPGVNFNNSNPGTVRSGVPTEVQTADFLPDFASPAGCAEIGRVADVRCVISFRCISRRETGTTTTCRKVASVSLSA